MRVGSLWFVYRRRLRAQWGEELLAVFGIAVGVALVFAVLVANQSISGSVGDVLRGIVGRATLEVRARDTRGFEQRTYDQLANRSAVRIAAPALVRRVTVVGPTGSRSLTLFGGDRRLQRLGGALTQRVGPIDVPALSLPEAVARPLGVHPGQRIELIVGERRVAARVGALLSEEDIGPLAKSPVAIAPLGYAQRLSGMDRRITHVLVEPRRERVEEATRELRRLGAGRFDVRPSDFESNLMREAAKSNDQSSLLFSAISAGIGLLFAYNAMLLTLATRRRICAEMRLIGFSRGRVLASLVFETAIVCVAGVALGLGLGEGLSRVVFGEVPRYLTGAFPIGSQRVVSASTVAIACAVGVIAAFGGAARPLRELYAVRPMDATHRLTLTHGEPMAGGHPAILFLGGIVVLIVVTAVALVIPAVSLVAATLCAVVSVAVLPLLLRALVRALDRFTRQGHRRAVVWIVAKEIAATPTRAVALAATAAVAVFGITTVEGARNDLIRGADVFASELAGTGDVHIVAGGPENYLALEPFEASVTLRRIRRLAIVESAVAHRGQLLDVGRRRIALFGRPPDTGQLAMESALTQGSLSHVAHRLRGGGWAAVSSGIAKERNVAVGGELRLPTPRGPRSFRIAAITTNYFWPPGSVVVSTRDYGRLWGETSASEVMVKLHAGVAASRGVREVHEVLGDDSGLRVLTASQRAAEFGATARQALTTLGQIGVLVLVCAVLAVAAAMGVAVWQRRQRLAALKAIGFRRTQLLRMIVIETGILLTVGGGVGAGLGLYAQAVASSWVELTSGSSVSYAPAIGLAALTLAILVLASTAVAAVPGRFASAVSPRAAFSD